MSFSLDANVVSLQAAAGFNTDSSVNVLVRVNTDGQVEAATASGNIIAGVSLEASPSAAAGAAIKVATTGVVPVIAHAGFAAGDSLVPAANGRATKKGTAAASTDRCIALETASAAGDVVQALLV